MKPAEWGGRPLWAEVDLDALERNVRLLAARAAPAKLWAVVKANAYGHGAVAVGRAALSAGASTLCVAAVDEAEELRKAGVGAPLMVMGYTPASDAGRVAALGLRITVASVDVLEAVGKSAQAMGAKVQIDLELETGFHRYGLGPEALVELAERARGTPGVTVQGIFTHFAAAGEGDLRFTQSQFETLRQVAARLPWVPEKHCSASAGVLLDPKMNLDAVRAGLALYGYRPSSWCGLDIGLAPVLSLRSRIARVEEVERGATVGYGRTWVAERPSRIALIMAGYADGFRRVLSNRGHVIVRGRRAPIVGRVSMDMTMVDVSANEDVKAGDVATLIGRDGNERIDADDLAGLSDTISWDVLAGISARVPRLYLRAGVVESVTTLTCRTPMTLG